MSDACSRVLYRERVHIVLWASINILRYLTCVSLPLSLEPVVQCLAVCGVWSLFKFEYGYFSRKTWLNAVCNIIACGVEYSDE